MGTGDPAAGPGAVAVRPRPTVPAVDPLIVTAQLDARAAAALGALRRRHFPPGRNDLAAHLTLFATAHDCT